MRLTLHVGLPKTALTTIQYVLERAGPLLAREGVLYPGSAPGHLALVREVQSGRLQDAAHRIDAMAAEMRVVGAEHLVLSCEHMSLISGRAVAGLKALIEARLPDLREVRILCYVREPIGFATSLCQQRLKSGTTRLAEFMADPWPLGYMAMIQKQVRAYGLSAVTLRYLHPDHLTGGTVADDVFAAIGLPKLRALGQVPMRVPVLNPSLSHEGAMVADALAGLVPRDARSVAQRRCFKPALEAIGGARFVLPEPVQQAIIAASRRDLKTIRHQFGLTITPELVPPSEGTAFDAALAEAMAREIIDQVAMLPQAGAGGRTP